MTARKRTLVRRKNAVPSQESVNNFVRQFNEETLYATGAYGRRPTAKDWNAGRDFMVLDPVPDAWVGGKYFSSRDAQTLYDYGIRRIIFGGAEGFTVDLVIQ